MKSTRRLFVSTLGALAFTTLAFREQFLGTARADEKAPRQSHDPGKSPANSPALKPNVTPDMIVTIVASVAGQEIFTAYAKDVKLRVYPHPAVNKAAAKAARTLELDAKALSSLPGGEVSVDGVALSSPQTIQDFHIYFDEIHAPGVKNATAFKEAMRRRDFDKTAPSPTLMISIKGGGSLLLDGVDQFNSVALSVGKEGFTMEEVGIRAQALVSLK